MTSKRTETSAEHTERAHFFGAAKLIAGVTLLSRVLGMVRDMAIASLGTTRLNDAFVLAFTIPNYFRRLFGEGALSAAFVPVFSETAEKQGLAAARGLLANAMGLLALLLAGLVVAIWTALAAWSYLDPGGPDRQLLLGLLAVMLPFAFTTCMLALGSAALNCRGHFAFPALAPVLLNLCMIAAAWGLARYWAGQLTAQLYVISASVAVAGVVQLIGVMWMLSRRQLGVRPRVRPIAPGIAPMARLMGPMVLGLGFLQFCELLNRLLAWWLTATEESPTLHLAGLELAKPLETGVMVRVYAASRLYQFPMGVLAVSLGVAVFPLLSRYASRGDMANLRESLNRALRLTLMEGLAAGTALFLLAEPACVLIFQRGDFGPADAAAAAHVLRMYVLGMWAYCSYQIFTRAFYSLKDIKTPLVVSCVLVVPNLAMVAALVWVPQLGAGAFGLAAAVTFAASTIIQGLLLRRRVGPFGGGRLVASLGRSLLACTAMAGAILACRWALGPEASAAAVLGACIPVGAVAFFAAALALRAPEPGEFLRAVRKRKAAD